MTYMINNLVGDAAVVLQDVEVHGASGLSDLLRDGLRIWLALPAQGPCGQGPRGCDRSQFEVGIII